MQEDLSQHVSEILRRDLSAVAASVEATPEEQLWTVPAGVNNSIGTLAFHVCGNLRHFVGATLGGDGYVRDRESEFRPHAVGRGELLSELAATEAAVLAALDQVSTETLAAPMPGVPARHEGRSVGFFLIQLCCHLSWHRGQLDYLQRFLGGATHPA